MGKIAFVFSGQGAQAPGMGRELYDLSAAARSVFALCDDIRPGTSLQCFEGTKEELTLTANTQPDLFAVELAAAQTLEEVGVFPDALAGFSLGEITALTFSGAVAPEKGFQLVCRRGELMQAAAEKVDSSMVAVVKLPPDRVEELATQFDGVYPVNYNSPSQTVCAGLCSVMGDFKAAVRAAGGRALPLKVSGGFHSPFMADAVPGLERVLEPLEIGAPRVPLYSNVTALPYETGQMKQLLARQIVSPVQWQTIVENMVDAGVDTFIEVGPGKTLCGLIEKIRPGVRTLNVEDAESLRVTTEAVKEVKA